ncbi:prephenate dehydratase [Desertibacillus haloalkaliphilus]|uniref:prephenate dehydratase n=1 Tax=Desertibacillus haloalkaliphilus TaxID=1328930 RepID=UPI001C2562CB|nr:prephenate dehydratase [Desertibacillus haloalkaliphilus]MBU8905482.1 prephenate dehydratase [Desertibacillus haloalkaliphilus]
MGNSVAYLGPKGTFTEMAAATIFPNEEHKPYTTIPNCMDGLAQGEVDYAVVPLENAIEGSVNLTLDYLIHKHNLPIVGEVTVPIEQHLMVHKENVDSWTTIKEVRSHPHAIAQCHEFLRNVLPDADKVYMNSTGSAVKWVKDHPEQPVAAIGNELAAKKYQLEIVQENIHDYDNNHTRFVILDRDGASIANSSPLYVGDKTTMMVTLPSDYSGALHQVLSAFAWRKLNLSKIESRPMKTGLGNYFFVIDVDHKMDDVLIPGVVAELQALDCGVRILGSYTCYSLTKAKKTAPSIK